MSPSCLVLTCLLIANGDPAAQLRRAKNEYMYGNYASAAEQLRALLYPMQLSTDEQVLQAHLYLALSHYLLEQSDEMREEFAKLLLREPDYKLDPFTVPPPVIDVFEKIRLDLKDQLEVIRQLRSDTVADEVAPGVRIEIERRFTAHSEFATFFPFGVGQFQNGQTRWGVLFATTELALLAVNLGAYLWASEIVGGGYPPSDRDLVRGLLITQYASLALFGATWSVGVMHARLHFRRFDEAPPIIRELPARSDTVPRGLAVRLQF